MLGLIIAFATIFGPASMDPGNPRSNLACSRAVFGEPRKVDTEIIAVASYKYPCGTWLLICTGNRCVRAQVLDRGPQRAQVDGPYEDDLDLSIALGQALGIGNARGQAACRRGRKGRGCRITYTVYPPIRFRAYRPPRS